MGVCKDALGLGCHASDNHIIGVQLVSCLTFVIGDEHPEFPSAPDRVLGAQDLRKSSPLQVTLSCMEF